MIKRFQLSILLAFLLSFVGQAQITDTVKKVSDTLLVPAGIMTPAQMDSVAKTEEAIAYRKNHTDFYVLRKGRLFASWGYNRANYSQSSIRFWGNGYDFTIINAVAKDRPSPVDLGVYLNPTLFTIPQYNFRIGYFITNKLSLSLSVDHMKYVFVNDQIAAVDGYVDSSASAKWAKEYDPTRLMEIPNDFVGYEHTDGLNVLSFELDYNTLFFETSNRKFAVDLVAGAGISAAVPKTNANLFGEIGNDAFHLSGGGISANVGLKLYFFKDFFIHPVVKMGWLHMPNVATNGLEIDKASQNISYFQRNITIGYQYKIAHK